MSKGYFCLVLHAHLPYVRHPEEEYFLEENWLYEAITETYIPLINVFDKLVDEGIDFRITMSLTPPLISMLQDPLLQDRYLKHLDKSIELSEKEIIRTRHEPHYNVLSKMYNERFLTAKDVFINKYKKDLVQAFKKFQDIGCLEIITCCATHGFLPILGVNPESVKAQVNIAVDHYKQVFGQPPKGIWLPECGYSNGIEDFLKDAGIKYFFLDFHGIVNAEPTPRYGVYAPLYTKRGVAAFGRDVESSKQVWSAREGYPGDQDYREYYRDIGYELDFDYIKPYIHPQGIRLNTGIKYWRITGDSGYKEAYNPNWAKEKAATHAGNFMFNREKQAEHLAFYMDRKPIIVAPYDAELYGHWWFEGPMFIDFLIRKIAFDQNTISLITPSEYLNEYPGNQVSVPSSSSWGYKGYSEFWLNEGNDWIYRHLHAAAKRMVELSERFLGRIDKKDKGTILIKRALNQAARELLLAESSDWPFIMKTGTMVPYANKRINLHIGRFTKLYEDILNDSLDEEWLKEVEWRDNIFSNMDCSEYYSKNMPLINKIENKPGATSRPRSKKKTAVEPKETVIGKIKKQVQDMTTSSLAGT